MQKYSINFVPGAHGHFMEVACNKIFFNLDVLPSERVTRNGTYHGLSDDVAQKYRDRNFHKGGYWLMERVLSGIPVVTPIVSYPITDNVINITNHSVLENALLRTYWRRVDDGFHLSPTELLKTSKTELLSFGIVNYQPRGVQSQVIRSIEDREKNLSRAVAAYTTEFLTEMDLIRFWINPNGESREYNHEWRWNTSEKFINRIKKHKHVVDFEMLNFYDADKFLSGIKHIAAEYSLEPQISDDEIKTLVKDVRKNVHEFPEDIELVAQCYSDIVDNKITDLSTLGLNDKLVLLSMLNITYGLYSEDYRKLEVFPKTSTELLDIISSNKTS